MKNPNRYGEFYCYECNDNFKFEELTLEEGDYGCPVCESDVVEICPFCGEEFDEDTRICGQCKERV